MWKVTKAATLSSSLVTSIEDLQNFLKNTSMTQRSVLSRADCSHRDLLSMNRATSGSSCLSTCFGVGGDEDVWGVRTESPYGVPVFGDVAHERNSSDRDEREASDGSAGLLDGFAVGHVLLLCHVWHCQKFSGGKQKAIAEIRQLKFLERGQCCCFLSSLSWLFVLCQNTHGWLASLHRKNSSCLQTSPYLIVRPTVTLYELLFHYSPPCVLLLVRDVWVLSPLDFLWFSAKILSPNIWIWIQRHESVSRSLSKNNNNTTNSLSSAPCS